MKVLSIDKNKKSEDKKSVKSIVLEDIYSYLVALPKIRESIQSIEIDFEELKKLFEQTEEQLEEKKVIKRLHKIPTKVEEISRFWFLNAPFFSEFLLRFVYWESTALPTVGVNIKQGKMNMYINPDFLYPLSFEERQFILLHEIMHFINNSFSRRENIINVDSVLFNIAADIPINEEVKNTTIAGKKCTPLVKGMFVRNIEKTFIQVDNVEGTELLGKHLTRKAKKDEDKEDVPFGKIIDIDDDIIIITMVNHTDFIANDIVHVHEDSGDGGEGKDGDMLEGDGSYNGKDDGDSKSKVGSCSGDISGHAVIESSDESKELVKEIVKVAKMRGWGNTPNSLRQMIDNLINPQVNWKRELKKALSTLFFGHKGKKDTWTRANRRGLPVQGKRKLSTEAIIAIDTSGSIFYDKECMKAFFTEIESIVKNHRVRIIEFDCEIQKEIYDYNKGDWKKLEPKGGGGTDVQPIYDYMIKNKLSKNKLVVLTDGYFSYDFNTHGIDTLWCCTEKDNEIPHGKNIYIEA